MKGAEALALVMTQGRLLGHGIWRADLTPLYLCRHCGWSVWLREDGTLGGTYGPNQCRGPCPGFQGTSSLEDSEGETS